jgi:hypothetical protein
VMVTFSNYGVKSIFYTSDAGASWTDVSGNLEENADGTGNGPSVTWAHIYNDGSATKYFVGTSVGLFSTDNLNGANTLWLQEGASTIGNVVINQITSRTFDNNIVVATHGNGIFSNKIFTPSAMTDVNKEKLNVRCYPNPFSHSVMIEVGYKQNSYMQAQVFDIAGRLVNTLSAAHSTRLEWNGNDSRHQPCGKGTYIIKLTCGQKTSVTKVVKL